MQLKRLPSIIKNNQNKVWALCFTVLLCTVISIFFDYYFDLNDDVVMKDILAGVYTGTPNGRNIQMLFPISWFISLFYFLPGNISWYGLFLCGCQFVSIYLITERLLSFFDKVYKKAVSLIVEAVFILALYFYELVMVQYTVTVALMAAAAVFLVYTAKTDVKPLTFLKNNVLSIVLIVVAFQIRSEMLLLMFPFICVAGLCKWATEKPFFTKPNALKYFSVFGAIIAGMILSEGVHILAYSQSDWKEFNSYFDSRTEVFDFYGVPAYEGNEEFYESIGLTKNEQLLLKNYNFGLDEEIDAELMKKISEYAAKQYSESASFSEKLKKAIDIYKYRLFYETDRPFNTLVILLYVIVLATALLQKHIRILWELPVLGVVRTGLWLYIQYRGRDPIRITHSLYLIEIVVLLSFFFWECKEYNKKNQILQFTLLGILGVYSLINLPDSVDNVCNKYDAREEVNQEIRALKDYTKQNSENFYFLDVYSSVDYSEKMFADVDNSLSNCDIMGGWVCKSPLMKEKYEKYGINSMEEALLSADHVFYVVQSPENSDWSLVSADWLPAYYKDHNIEIELNKEDTINTTSGECFTVYRISQVNE